MARPSTLLFLVLFASTGCASRLPNAHPASAVATVTPRPAPAPRPASSPAPIRVAPDRSAHVAGLEASAAAYALCEQQTVVACAAACDGGNAYACTELGDKYILGERVKGDRKRGIAILTRACEEGTEMACLRLAARVDHQDPPLAAALQARVCLQGIVDPDDGCAEVIQLIEHGAFKPDPAQSLAIYRRACALGSPGSACGRVKDLAVVAAATPSGATATGGASNGKLAPAHAR
jgi:hypothetical protein